MTPDGPPDRGYYENVREDLLPLVKPAWMRILDVGCGAGRLGAALKALAPAREVHGIEIMPEVAREAGRVLDSVTVGDIQVLEPPFAPETFDGIILADVLEHLLDPAAVLQKLRPLVRPGGGILCSIPNMRHYTVLLRLIRTGWSYDDYGLFDRTHLRFFSLATMKELLASSGWVIELVRPRVVASRKFRLLNAASGGRLEEFLAMQYILRAHPVR